LFAGLGILIYTGVVLTEAGVVFGFQFVFFASLLSSLRGPPLERITLSERLSNVIAEKEHHHERVYSINVGAQLRCGTA
jgi:hypothetical protein